MSAAVDGMGRRSLKPSPPAHDRPVMRVASAGRSRNRPSTTDAGVLEQELSEVLVPEKRE